MNINEIDNEYHYFPFFSAGPIRADLPVRLILGETLYLGWGHLKLEL